MDQAVKPAGRVSGGWKTFLTIWSGQLISLLGSGLSGFALGLWVLRNTGSVTRFALIAACTLGPRIFLLSITGALADRWDRRRTMLASEMVAAMVTLYLAVMMAVGHLGVWQICAAMSAIGVCAAFQWSACAASITVLVAKDQFGRARGMVQIAQGLAQTLAPAMAGVIMQSTLGVTGI